MQLGGGNKEEDGAGQDRMAQTMGPLAEEEGSSGPPISGLYQVTAINGYGLIGQNWQHYAGRPTLPFRVMFIAVTR